MELSKQFKTCPCVCYNTIRIFPFNKSRSNLTLAYSLQGGRCKVTFYRELGLCSAHDQNTRSAQAAHRRALQWMGPKGPYFTQGIPSRDPGACAGHSQGPQATGLTLIPFCSSRSSPHRCITYGTLGQPLRTLCQRWWVTLHHLSKRRVFTALAAGREKGVLLK